jgi:hypothetical protein
LRRCPRPRRCTTRSVLSLVFHSPVVAKLPEDEKLPDEVVKLLEDFKPPEAAQLPGVAKLPEAV